MATQPQFAAGDLVELKSGGPRMTVALRSKSARGTDEEYLCIWFDTAGAYQEVTVPAATLKKIAAS